MIKWLTRKQLAAKLGIHPNSIPRYERKKGFPKRSMSLGVPRWEDRKVDQYMKRLAKEKARKTASSRPEDSAANDSSSSPSALHAKLRCA